MIVARLLPAETPATLFHTQLQVLDRALPLVRDGHSTGIHDARIATRRIRELLPLIHDPHRLGTGELAARFRRLGRSLGRVRDADVRVSLLALLEQRIPHAAPTLVVLRQQRERDRLMLVRKLIKRLERLDALRLVERLLHYRPTWLSAWSPSLAVQWRRDLNSIVAARMREADAAVAHATGVYFPNRCHTARIAIKRLRYALEVADRTGRSDQSAALRELKKAQDILGDLHDRQTLIDDLLAVPQTPVDGVAHDHESIALVRQVVEAETRRLHEQYIERRERLVQICRDGTRDAFVVLSTPALLAAGGLALTTGAYVARLTRRRQRAAILPPDFRHAAGEISTEVS